MRTMATACFLLGAMFLFTNPASAQDTWLGGSPLRAQVRVGADGDTWVGVWVDAPTVSIPATRRAPMAVSLVVDTSGSMAGDKIRNAQMATASLLESLADGDIVSIYGFSQSVSEIAPPTVVSSASRGMLMDRVRLLVAGGGTNMYDGMQVAVSRLATAPTTHTIRRIFLISDGHANVGPSDPQSLGDLASRGTEWGTQVTAIGVGYDYDPVTLNSMVVRSAGRLHHLGAPHQMASILEQELHRMSQSVALNGVLTITPAHGVSLVSGATTGVVIEGGQLRFALGAMDSGQRREILFRVRVPTGALGRRSLGTATFSYETPDGGARATQSAQLTYEVARVATATREVPRVAAMVVQHEASEAQRRAADLVAHGQAERAARELEQARAGLARAAVEFADDEVSGELRRRSESIERDVASTRAATSAPAQRERAYELQAAPMAAEGY